MAAKKKTTSKARLIIESDIIDPSSIAPPDKTMPEPYIYTEFELRFCQEYIKDLNATQSYLRARTDKELANTTARTEGAKLLAKPHIQAQIQHLADERSKRTRISADKVLGDLGEISASDIRRLYDDNGALRPPHQWPDDLAMAIKEVETFEVEEWDASTRMKVKIGEIKKVKFWDKIKTRELIGKHLKLFTEKVEHSGSVSLEQLVGGSIKKDT